MKLRLVSTRCACIPSHVPAPALLLLLAVCSAAPAAAADDAPPVFTRVAPSVVTVIAEVDGGTSSGQGSGVVVSRGHVATNCHVVRDADRLKIPENATVSGFQAKGNELFATIDFHGVFVFLSGANQWQAINLGLPDQVDVNAITVLNDLLVIGTNKHGFFISRDDGRLWSQSNAGLPNIPVRSLISVKDNLYAGTDKGIYVSSDGGLHWRYQYGKVQVNGFTYVNEKIYAALVDGDIVSDDYGKSWKYIYKPNTLHDISNDGSFIYAITLGADGLVRTNNDGRWK